MASTGKDTFEKLDITEQEIKNITEALKDEKFRKMFVEYAEEISNPENRKLYEQEIAQLENERGMNVQFIHPKPGHVLKTSVDGDKKAFINICQNDKVGKPSSEKQIGPNGVRGLNWSIPHSQTPPREDLDKAGKTCMVYDVVFHPDTYRMGESNVRFRKLIEDTALDGVEKQFGVKLDRKNIKRPKINFKGTPVASIIRTKADEGEAEKKTLDENDPLSKLPYPYGNKTSEEKAKEIAEEVKRKEEQKKKVAEKTTFKNPKKNTTNEPKYSIIHRSNMDIQEYRNAPDARLNSTRPKELVIKVELPLLSSAAQVDLDIFEQKLSLESSKPAAYKLELNLPYPVDDDQGSAKFDKSKRCLIITLPVLPEENVQMPSFIDKASDSTDQDMDTATSNCNNNNVSPLIQELPDNERKEQSPAPVPVEKKEPAAAFSPKVSYSLPYFTYNQDDETISYILHVKNVNFDSVSKSFPSQNVCDVKFVTVGSGGFPVHYRITFKFDDDCYIVGEHCSIDVNETNVAVVLLKDRSCRGTWNSFQAGIDENMKDYFFVTEDNIIKEIEKLEEDAKDFVKDDTTPSSSTLEVTEMSQKKLTIQIKPKKKKATFMVGDEPIDIAEESDTEDTPSSAEIKVIHEKTLPNLHGILKQRSISESSDDYSLNGSCSPGSPRDDIFNGLRKSVSFNEKIDSTTYKPGASVTTMTQTLKNKRRRNRRREEKRKRHNSGGSEGSSGDDHDHKYASDSHSEGNESDHTNDDKSGEKPKGKSKHPRKRKNKNNKKETKEELDTVLDDLLEEDDIPCPELEEIPDSENDVKASSIQNDLDEECPDLEEIPEADLICGRNDDNDSNPDTEKISSVMENGKMSVNEENMLSEKVKKKLNISSSTSKTNDKCDSDDDVCEGDDDKDNLRTKVKDLGDWEKVKMSQKESDERTSGDDKENSKITTDSSQDDSNSGNNEKKMVDVISSGKNVEERMNGPGDDSGVECGSDTPHTEEESNKAANLNNMQGDSTSLNWSSDNIGTQDHRTQCAFSFSNSVVYDLDVD